MAVTLKRLAATLLGTSATQVYPASSANAQIDACTLTNHSGSAVTVNIWIGGAAADDSNAVVKTRSVPATDSILVREMLGQVVPDGGALFASASTAGVVALVVGGREQSTS